MSADIVKESVYDARVFQHPAKFAVEKGALSVTNAVFSAIGLNTSQQSFNLYVPSENVFVDRALEWTSSVYLQFTCAYAPVRVAGGTYSATTVGGPTTQGTPICVFGQDISVCAFPLNSLVTVMQSSINDTTVTINSQDVLKQVLRLTDYKKNRTQRTCPTMLDRYNFYGDAGNTSVNSANNSYLSATDYSEDPNGAFAGFQWCDSAGNVLAATGSNTAIAGSTAVNYAGVPCVPSGASATASTYTLFCKITSTEKLVLSPFVFSDAHEWDVGLFGINNITLVCNMGSPSRLLRNNTTGSWAISNIQYATGAKNGGVSDAAINVQFLTPPLGLELPAKSIVPYMEFPRFISNTTQTIPAGGTAKVSSQTITLPQIPDMFIIYAKPASYSPQEGDWVFPINSRFTGDGTSRPLSVNFDNYSGLLSSQTTEQLYAMSVRNGLDMDWMTWIGKAHTSGQLTAASLVPVVTTSAANGGGGYYAAYPSGGVSQDTSVSGFYGGSAVGGGFIPLVGGPLVLKPSQDITLSTGQAPSLVGNFTFQFDVSLYNPTNVTQSATLYVITVNSGFFESIRGSSRIVKGVLSEQDIISAPVADAGDATTMGRYVGGFRFLKNLATRATKAVSSVAKHAPGIINTVKGVAQRANDVYQKTKPQISALKSHLPADAAAALGRLGYGMSHHRFE